VVSTARGVTSELPLWASRACSAKSYHSTAVNRHQMPDIRFGVCGPEFRFERKDSTPAFSTNA